MKIAFRADASIQIGTGHVMRCLTLANALREQGAECTFVCRAHEGHLAKKIEAASHTVHLLLRVDDSRRPDANADLYAHWLGCGWQQDADQTVEILENDYDWLVVDHYGLDARWEAAVRHKAKRILAIDDLANRAHDCDLLLDQNLGRTAQDYDGLVADSTLRLVGATYALLRPEFAQLREYSLNRRKQPQLQRLLITMGGVDKDNVTGQVLDGLRGYALPEGCQITVVMGAHAPWLETVRAQAEAFPGHCEVRVNVGNMAQLMADSDLAIGAAGSSSWERCCLGVPSIAVVLAENQQNIALVLSEVGAALMAGSPDAKEIRTQLGRFLGYSRILQTTSAIAATIVNGKGVDVVAKHLNSVEMS